MPLNDLKYLRPHRYFCLSASVFLHWFPMRRKCMRPWGKKKLHLVSFFRALCLSPSSWKYRNFSERRWCHHCLFFFLGDQYHIWCGGLVALVNKKWETMPRYTVIKGLLDWCHVQTFAQPLFLYHAWCFCPALPCQCPTRAIKTLYGHGPKQ